MVVAWGESSDADDYDDDKQALMAIGESNEETEVHALDTTILELRYGNLKLKLGIGKTIAGDTQLTLEENVGKMKDELYKRDEHVRVLKEDMYKVKHELDRTCKWNRSSDALSCLQEHHSSNRRGFALGTLHLSGIPKASTSQFLRIRSAHTVVKGSNQIWYMDSGCSKHMAGSKNQFISLGDLKGGNVSFGNGKKGGIIGVEKYIWSRSRRMGANRIENRSSLDWGEVLRQLGSSAIALAWERAAGESPQKQPSGRRSDFWTTLGWPQM
uniref:Retrovirus-related Pol polyprotein from transposon TNT 1-94-like beta-barrel domain-containing protein n=1 Tax=Nicotiana tabacum TaxID=4097 RepID=A0A1S4D441_TOBAC|nr:PREDICTED: uncharacterized protein LOC107825740 [Nicotiana tabacum]